jgi:hypothetical protein
MSPRSGYNSLDWEGGLAAWKRELELERSVESLRLRPQRGGAWAGLGGDKYHTPIVIYAANPDASPLEEPSQRPFQTVIPLSRRLGLTPIADYQVGQVRKLVSAVVCSSGSFSSCGSIRRSPAGFFQRADFKKLVTFLRDRYVFANALLDTSRSLHKGRRIIR